MMMDWSWDVARKLCDNIQLPAMFVDLDSLEANIDSIKSVASERRKKVRLATKSIRVPALIKMIMDRGAPVFDGLMCYSTSEADFLSESGFADILMGYPTPLRHDLENVAAVSRRGHKIMVMADSIQQLEIYEKFWKSISLKPLQVCVDIDVSLRVAGQHFGVQRSSIRSLGDFDALLENAARFPSLTVSGVMAYEAQVAGLGDTSPFGQLLNPVKSMIRSRSKKFVACRRAEVSLAVKNRGLSLDVFNGGGSGSVASTSSESCVTEVTVGSGVMNSHLFDYFSDNSYSPALCFALPVTRHPERDIITCQSGGFVASGEPGWDKCPVVFLPENLVPISHEGFGEVQTPLRGERARTLNIGDPIFFRPAKAGEPAERFSHYHLVRGNKVLQTVPTYRGLGKTFY